MESLKRQKYKSNARDVRIHSMATCQGRENRSSSMHRCLTGNLFLCQLISLGGEEDEAIKKQNSCHTSVNIEHRYYTIRNFPSIYPATLEDWKYVLQIISVLSRVVMQEHNWYDISHYVIEPCKPILKPIMGLGKTRHQLRQRHPKNQSR